MCKRSKFVKIITKSEAFSSAYFPRAKKWLANTPKTYSLIISTIYFSDKKTDRIFARETPFFRYMFYQISLRHFKIPAASFSKSRCGNSKTPCRRPKLHPSALSNLLEGDKNRTKNCKILCSSFTSRSSYGNSTKKHSTFHLWPAYIIVGANIHLHSAFLT